MTDITWPPFPKSFFPVFLPVKCINSKKLRKLIEQKPLLGFAFCCAVSRHFRLNEIAWWDTRQFATPKLLGKIKYRLKKDPDRLREIPELYEILSYCRGKHDTIFHSLDRSKHKTAHLADVARLLLATRQWAHNPCDCDLHEWRLARDARVYFNAWVRSGNRETPEWT